MAQKRYKVAVQGWVNSGDGPRFRFFDSRESAERFAQVQCQQSWLQVPWSVTDRISKEIYTIDENGKIDKNLTFETSRACGRR